MDTHNPLETGDRQDRALLISCEIAAEILALSPMAVSQLVEAGDLPPFIHDGGGRELLPLARVQRLAAERSRWHVE